VTPLTPKVRPILLVEDDPDDILLFREAAKRASIANPIDVAVNGEDAIAYCEALRGAGPMGLRAAPVVICLDLKLPRKNGLEVLAWLRDEPGLRRIPVVVLSSSNQESDVSRAYDLGANSYFVKPVSFDELKVVVELLRTYWGVHNRPPELFAP
jgi:CheY-like chemotaxis protein